MFLWEESKAVAEYVSGRLEIGVADVLFCVNYEEDDEISKDRNIMGRTLYFLTHLINLAL